MDVTLTCCWSSYRSAYQSPKSRQVSVCPSKRTREEGLVWEVSLGKPHKVPVAATLPSPTQPFLLCPPQALDLHSLHPLIMARVHRLSEILPFITAPSSLSPGSSFLSTISKMQLMFIWFPFSQFPNPRHSCCLSSLSFMPDECPMNPRYPLPSAHHLSCTFLFILPLPYLPN